jgi:hypothetical protein
MLTAANGSRCQQALLEAIQGASGNGSVSFNPAEVMRQTVQNLGAQSDDDVKRAILCCFNDLLRTGAVGLGVSLARLKIPKDNRAFSAAARVRRRVSR